MPILMTQAEREAVEAMEAAAQALTKATELAERADYGTQIMQSLVEAQKELRFALDTAHGRN